MTVFVNKSLSTIRNFNQNWPFVPSPNSDWFGKMWDKQKRWERWRTIINQVDVSHARLTQGASYLDVIPGCLQKTSSFSISCLILPTCPIWVLYLIPMACKRHLWSTNLALVTFLRLDDLINKNFMYYSPTMPNLGSISHSHVPEEAPVVHQPGPGHLVGVGQPHHWPFHDPLFPSCPIWGLCHPMA